MHGLALRAGVDSVKGRNNRRKRPSTKVELLIFRHAGYLITSSNQCNLGDGSILVYSLRVHDNVGAHTVGTAAAVKRAMVARTAVTRESFILRGRW